MLIKKDTYLLSAAELVSVDRFRFCLMVANVVVSIMILLIAVLDYIGFHPYRLALIEIVLNTTLVFQVGCLLAWT